MEKARILIIEDNADTRQFLTTVLTREFEVICTENAIVGIEFAKTQNPQLIIMDVTLPILSGFDACTKLKQDEATKHIPIIFLSARHSVNDIVQGLERGAEDYLAKPFDYKELLARVHARLRSRMAYRNEPKILQHDDLKLVIDTHETFIANRFVSLTQTEFDILRLLVERRGQIIPRMDIIVKVWKEPLNRANKRTIDVHIRALRKKIPALTHRISAIYGEGYKLD